MTHDDRELTQLMNQVLDGEASSEESERLRRTLESRPELRAEYEKLSRAVAALDCLGMEEPPASLKQDVLRSIRSSEAPERARGWLGSVSLLLGGVGGFRYATTFATGAALGVLAVGILTGSFTTGAGPVDSRSMSGAMLPLSKQVISKRLFTLRPGSVLLETLPGRDGIQVRLTADVPAGTDITVSYDPAEWGARSVIQDPAGNEVLLGTGRFSVRMQRLGRNSYLLDLARSGPAGSPLRIAIHSPDGFVQGELDTRAPHSGS